jgi:hypothetical protein
MLAFAGGQRLGPMSPRRLQVRQREPAVFDTLTPAVVPTPAVTFGAHPQRGASMVALLRTSGIIIGVFVIMSLTVLVLPKSACIGALRYGGVRRRFVIVIPIHACTEAFMCGSGPAKSIRQAPPGDRMLAYDPGSMLHPGSTLLTSPGTLLRHARFIAQSWPHQLTLRRPADMQWDRPAEMAPAHPPDLPTTGSRAHSSTCWLS